MAKIYGSASGSEPSRGSKVMFKPKQRKEEWETVLNYGLYGYNVHHVGSDGGEPVWKDNESGGRFISFEFLQGAVDYLHRENRKLRFEIDLLKSTVPEKDFDILKTLEERINKLERTCWPKG